MKKKREDIKTFLRKLEKELELKEDTLEPNINLKDAQFWDSLLTMNLIFYFDSEYSINIQAEEISNFLTPRDIYKRIFK